MKTQPLTTRPLPVCVAPSVWDHGCWHCFASGVEPDEENGAVPCGVCGGCGVLPVTFRLQRSRTHKFRWCEYDPLSAVLTLTQGKRTQRYDVRPFDPAPEYGVALLLVKTGGADEGQVYALQCGPAGVTCDCAGATYESVGKANQRAWEESREIFPSMGCIHTDACVSLIKAGWFFDMPGAL